MASLTTTNQQSKMRIYSSLATVKSSRHLSFCKDKELKIEKKDNQKDPATLASCQVSHLIQVIRMQQSSCCIPYLIEFKIGHWTRLTPTKDGMA